METKDCLLCGQGFQTEDKSDSGGILIDNSNLNNLEIVDCYALDSHELCDVCKDKRPEQVVKELKASGRM